MTQKNQNILKAVIYLVFGVIIVTFLVNLMEGN